MALGKEVYATGSNREGQTITTYFTAHVRYGALKAGREYTDHKTVIKPP